MKKKTNWYKTGGYSTVKSFCPFTPGNCELAKKWREMEAREAETRGWRYEVVECGGRQVKSIVCKNPWSGPCTDQDCFICSTGGTGNCRQPGCTYKVQCLACRDQGSDTVPDFEEVGGNRQGQGEVGVPCLSRYHGQSGYCGNVRGAVHQDEQKANKTSNAMMRHNNLYHRSEKVPYQMSVVSLHKKPMGRLLREGEDIVAGNQTILFNTKEEFLQGAVPSTRTQR